MVGWFIVESRFGYEKEHLSFSSIRLWNSNQAQYRSKYYVPGGKGISTVYTKFGKKIAEILESRDYSKYPELRQVPYYPESEHPLDVFIGDVKVVGYLDLFDPAKNSIGEVKTGVPGSWDAVKVRKWDQLPMYSLLVKRKFGYVDPVTHLFWLETRLIEQKGMLRNQALELTGKIEMFPRKITEAQRKRQRDIILQAAREIEKDYEEYRKRNNQ